MLSQLSYIPTSAASCDAAKGTLGELSASCQVSETGGAEKVSPPRHTRFADYSRIWPLASMNAANGATSVRMISMAFS